MIEPHDGAGFFAQDFRPFNLLHRIGEDCSERLDIIPAQLRVLVVRRPKYACRACEEVVVQAQAGPCFCPWSAVPPHDAN